jgi:hypothetical protein
VKLPIYKKLTIYKKYKNITKQIQVILAARLHTSKFQLVLCFFNINFTNIFASKAKAYQGGSHLIYLHKCFYIKKRMFTKIQTRKDTTNNKEEDRHN